VTRALDLGIRALGALGLAGFLVTAFTPFTLLLSDFVVAVADERPADAIVVLGHDIAADGTLSRLSLQRAVHGIRLYTRGLAPLIVFSGAQNATGISEALVRAHMAREFGVPPAAILTESAIQRTRDEARRIHALLEPRGARRVLLVSERVHLKRAAPLFERAGFAVSPAPSDALPDPALDPENRVWMIRIVLGELLARFYAATL
jgi:uncharacterized SAM-binding protein YcdF (DUF218 family)